MRIPVLICCLALAALAPAALAAAPVSVTAPQVTGNPVVGEILTTTTGTWTGGDGTFAYQWYRAPATIPAGGYTPTAIAGATASTYRLTTDDVGWKIYVGVRAYNGTASASRGSNSVGPVAASGSGPPASAVPALLARPAITGDLLVGATLTASPGNWTGTPDQYRYWWFRCGVADDGTCAPESIVGATATGYVLTAAEMGADVFVKVAAHNAAGWSAWAASETVGPVSDGSVDPDEEVVPDDGSSDPGGGGQPSDPGTEGSGTTQLAPAILARTTSRPRVARERGRLVLRPALKVTCPRQSTGCFGDATARARVRGRTVLLGRTKLGLGPASFNHVVTITLNAAGRRALRSAAHLHVTVTLTVGGERAKTVRLVRRVVVRWPATAS